MNNLATKEKRVKRNPERGWIWPNQSPCRVTHIFCICWQTCRQGADKHAEMGICAASLVPTKSGATKAEKEFANRTKSDHFHVLFSKAC